MRMRSPTTRHHCNYTYPIQRYASKVKAGWDIVKFSDNVLELPPGAKDHLSLDMLQRALEDTGSIYRKPIRERRLTGRRVYTTKCVESVYDDGGFLYYPTATEKTTLKYVKMASNEPTEDIVPLPGQYGVLCTVRDVNGDYFGSYVLGIFTPFIDLESFYKQIVFRKEGFVCNIDLPNYVFKRIARVIGAATKHTNPIATTTPPLYYCNGEIYVT